MMITGVRSALLCEKVEEAADGAYTLHRLYPDTLRVSSRPGFAEVWLWLLLELDGKPSLGTVKLRAEHLSLDSPIATPGGLSVTGAMFPFHVPVLRPGHLTISIHPAGSKKPFRHQWRLDFTDGAENSGPGAEESILAAVAESSRLLQEWFDGGARH